MIGKNGYDWRVQAGARRSRANIAVRVARTVRRERVYGPISGRSDE